MKQFINQKFIVSLSIILIFFGALSWLFLKMTDDLNDLSDIRTEVDQYDVKFKSERGFGNDRFDIYSFSLKSPEKNTSFKTIDRHFEKAYENFTGMFNIELEKNADLNKLKGDIEKLIAARDLQYMQITLDGTKKLYVYSKAINQGYCLILTIQSMHDLKSD